LGCRQASEPQPVIREIEDAAEEYLKLREKWQNLGEKLTDAKDLLLATMHSHLEKLSVNAEGDRIYSYQDEIVILKPGQDSVKVKHAKTPADEDEKDDE